MKVPANILIEPYPVRFIPGVVSSSEGVPPSSSVDISCQYCLTLEPFMSRTSPKECPKHHGHKGDPGVTPGTCGAGGEKAQVILVWVRAPGVGNASHPRGLGVMRVRP